MNRIMQKTAVLSLSLLAMSATAISSSVADMVKSFPEISPEKVMSIVTLPSLMVIFFSLIGGRLSMLMKRKTLLGIGLVLYIIGGIGPYFFNSFNLIIVLRGIFGAGLGIVAPFNAGLVGDIYEGDEQTLMMGLQSASVNIGTMVTGFLAGILGVSNWHNVFWVYSMGLVILALMVFFLPEKQRDESKSAAKAKLSPAVFKYGILCLLFFIVITGFFTNISILINDDQLGNSASSGLSVTIFYASGILAGIIFKSLSKALKGFMSAAILGVAALGFIILAFAHSIGVIYVSAAAIGFCFATVFPYVTVKFMATVPKSAATLANSVFLSIINIGILFSPFVFSFIGKLFNDNSSRFYFLFSAICLLGACLIALLLGLRTLKVRKEQQYKA